MLMVIFGAGASFDSVASMPALSTGAIDHAFRPPLTNRIFETGGIQWKGELINSLRYIRPLVQEFDELGFTPDFESALETWQSRSLNRQSVERQLIALRFYLQRLFKTCSDQWPLVAHGRTNYLRLLTQLGEWGCSRNERICLVTFNYDTLLDQACRDNADLRIGDINDYVAREDLKLFKPHGSVNWARAVRIPSFVTGGNLWEELAQDIISEGAKKMDLTSDYYTNDRGDAKRGQHTLLPAIAIPLASKAVFECPDSHKKALEECMSQVTSILVIGWRATERHFLDLWKGKSSQVREAVVVNGTTEAGNATIEGLVSAGIAGVRPLNMGFTSFLKGTGLSDYLKSI